MKQMPSIQSYLLLTDADDINCGQLVVFISTFCITKTLSNFLLL